VYVYVYRGALANRDAPHRVPVQEELKKLNLLEFQILKIELHETAFDLVEVRKRPNVTRDIRQFIVGHVLWDWR
jgi:hypothetical protein